MPSLIEGYNYDIFISYRQKDNKHDGWVTEFVDNLKGELESTFKEEVSVYFDINPSDGLLETHDVDESLKEKLKCLVFIPIISRTYCDPNSFAWEHEFKAFVEQASNDEYGLKVRLPNGNVSSRVLPVRIHDLYVKDIKSCELILGGALRGIDFIYKSSGINRPLRSMEEKPLDNLYKTIYRDQVNKMTLAIREIISVLKGESNEFGDKPEEEVTIGGDQVLEEKSIAVLPFADMSAEKDQEYFCDGITEEIINALAHIDNLKVIARTSAFAFKGRQADIREIGRILGVETILEGSIKKSSDRIRITTQLIKVADGSHIWSERYDREMKDLFDIQDEISLAVADNLKFKLLGETQAMITKRRSENPEAYILYLKGTCCYQMLTPEGFRKATDYFEQALKLDPNYALAYAELGYIIWLGSMWGHIPPGKAYPRIREYVEKSLKIDNNLAQAYSLLGTIYTFNYWDWKEAEQYYKRALKINPSSPIIHSNYSVLLSFSGRHEEAIHEAKRAQEIDPLSGYINARAGMAFIMAGLYDKAVEEIQMALSLNPHFFFTHLILGAAYLAKSMFREAIDEFKIGVDLSNGTQMSVANLGFSYYQVGEITQAEKLFESLEKRSETEYIFSTIFYMIYRLRGEEDLAFEWLQKTCDEHDTFFPFLRALVHYHPVFIFPEGGRYTVLLREAGFLK
jgi:adenylate cyclase